MSFIRKHPILIIFIAGLLIRVSLMFLDFSFDVNSYISWAQDALNRGLPGFYETPSKEVFGVLYPNYPPLTILILTPFLSLYQFIFKIIWWLNITFPIFPSKIMAFVALRIFEAGIFKIPSIIGDLGLAWIVYLFAKKLIPKKQKLHLIAPLLILLNPALIFNSSLWGQVDSIAVFLLLVSFYWLFFTKNFKLSTVFFFLSLLIKPTILISLPIYGLGLLNKFGWLKTIKSFFIGNLVFWLFFLPFHKTGNILIYPYTAYYQMIVLAQGMNFVSISALNVWSFFPKLLKIKDSAKLLGPLSFQATGYLIIAILMIKIVFRYFKTKDKLKAFLYAGFLINFAMYLFSTRMHERYIIFSLPFLLLIALKESDKLKWFIGFSILVFLNLYYGWPALNIKIAFDIATSLFSIFLLSTLNIFVFLYFFWKDDSQ